jgi:hypothetical protein
MLGSRRGYVVGSVLQLLIIGYGFWLHTMFFVGVLFAGLWVLSLVMGTRAEREAERRWGPRPGSPGSSALPLPGASGPSAEGE